MKKRFLSVVSSLVMIGMMLTVNLTHVEASETGVKKVDGSYLTSEESSS